MKPESLWDPKQTQGILIHFLLRHRSYHSFTKPVKSLLSALSQRGHRRGRESGQTSPLGRPTESVNRCGLHARQSEGLIKTTKTPTYRFSISRNLSDKYAHIDVKRYISIKLGLKIAEMPIGNGPAKANSAVSGQWNPKQL